MPDSCPDPETLAGWLEGSLPEGDGARLAAHLAACDECRRAAALAATMGPVPAAPLDEGLLERVAAASRRRPAWHWARWAAALLAAAGLLWIAWPRDRAHRDSPPVARPPTVPSAAPLESVEPPPPPPGVPETVPVPPPPPPAPPPERVVEPAPPGKVEEPREEMAREPLPPAPREEPEPPKEPEPPPREEAPAPVPHPEGPGRTTTDPSEIFASVYAVDPKGDLWIRRGPGEPARAGAFENMARTDALLVRDGGAGFTLDGRATVVMERGAEAVFCYFKPERAYAVDLLRGVVMIDTEGTPQNWRASCGAAALHFTSLAGRVAIEARGGGLSALLLEGRSGFRAGTRSGRLEAGREVAVSPEGKTTSGRAETKTRSRRFAELRPPFLTSFAATFDGGKEDGIFPFAIETGHPLREGEGGFLRALPSEEPGRVLLAAGIRLSRPVVYGAGLTLRFRYRSPVPSMRIRLGKFSAPFSGTASPERWVEGEIPVARFEHEGVPILPLEEISGVRFEAVLERGASGRLDVDGIQLGRRAR